jgi:hypothetical protein
MREVSLQIVKLWPIGFLAAHMPARGEQAHKARKEVPVPISLAFGRNLHFSPRINISTQLFC